jgi:hypothetical protein
VARAVNITILVALGLLLPSSLAGGSRPATVVASRPVPRPAPTAAPPAPVPFSDLPDLTQSDPRLGLPGGGASYCAPVAVSNGLIRLAPRCPGLVLPGGQIDLAKELASGRYFGTSQWSGTGPTGVLVGLHRFLTHHGCTYRRLEYQGWRAHPARFGTGVRVPSLEWIARALAAGGTAFLHVGWYEKSRYANAYGRHGGHWLTVAAVTADGFVLHDPAPYAGPDFANEEVRAERIESGWLLDGTVALPAQGYHRLGGGMHVKRAEDVAILDGAVVLEL